MILLLAAIAMLQSLLSGDGIEPLTRAEDRACTADGALCVGLTQQTRDGEPVFTPVIRAPDALPAAPQGAPGLRSELVEDPRPSIAASGT